MITRFESELHFEDTAELAESPVWDEATQTLFWIECDPGTLHRLSATGDHTVRSLGGQAGCVAPAASGGLIAAVDRIIVALDGLDSLARPLATVIDDPRLMFNDGKCAPDGTLWVGVADRSLAPGRGSLYRVAPNGIVTELQRGLTLPNGLAWSIDGSKAYLIDSLAQEVRVHTAPFHSIGELVLSIEPVFGIPDGMAIDTAGCLWIAHWGGSAVRCLDPVRRKLVAEVRLPVANVSSCCFGGPDLATLFITTGRHGLTAGECREQPLSGSVFRAKVGVRGLPVGRFGAR